MPIQFVYGCLPNATTSPTVRLREGGCSVKTRLNLEASPEEVYCSRGVSCKRISPDSGGCIPARVLSRVDFPIPLGPVTAASSPRESENVMFFSMTDRLFLLLYPIERSLTARTVCFFFVVINMCFRLE